MNMTKRSLAILISLLLNALSVQAGYVINFEDQTEWTAYERHDVTIGTVKFLGGRVTHIINDTHFTSKVFYSAYVPPVLPLSDQSSIIEIDFAHPTAGIEFDLWNGLSTALYSVGDDEGNHIDLTVPAWTNPQNGSNVLHVIYPFANVHRLLVVATKQTGFWDFAIDNLKASDDPCGTPGTVSTNLTPGDAGTPACDLERLAIAIDGEVDAQNHPVVHTQKVSNVMRASVPFGSQFTLTLERLGDDHQYHEVNSIVSAYRDVRDVSPPLPSRFNIVPYITPAFPTQVLLPFAPPLGNPKRFRVVHAGSEEIDIKPGDRPLSDPPTVLFITTYMPDTLGKPGKIARLNLDNVTKFDARILKFANERGLPPEYIKAQIEQETGQTSATYFNPQTWRYEPLSKDYGFPNALHPSSVSLARPAAAEQDNLDLIHKDPWQHYRFPDGDSLVLADINPRTILSICNHTTGIPRTINVCATPITGCEMPTVRELFNGNRGQNWDGVVADPSAAFEVKCAIPPPPTLPGGHHRIVPTTNDLLNFVGQTGIASSYGLMQPVHGDACGGPLWWKGTATGARNPSFLFDTDANLVLDDAAATAIPLGGAAGSLRLGMNKVLQLLRAKAAITRTSFPSEVDYLDQISLGFHWYTGGGIPEYWPNVHTHGRDYLPQVKGNTFTTSTCTEPAIQSQTPGASVREGGTAVLGLVVQSEAPLTYSWYAVTSEGNQLVSTDGATYVAHPLANTRYIATATSDCGIVTSAPIDVTVTPLCELPVIATGPSVTLSDSTAVLSVTTTANATYQWLNDDVFSAAGSGNVTPAAMVPGGNGPSVTVPRTTSARTFRVVIDNTCGEILSSVVTVPPLPGCPDIRQIASSAGSTVVAAGTAVVLTVTATGIDLQYSWTMNGVPAGASSSITVTPAVTSTYNVVVSNSCGQAAGSITVPVQSAGCALNVDISPPSAALLPGANVFTLTVSQPEEPGPQYSYQWYHGAGQALPAFQGVSMTASLASQYDVFWCVVTRTVTNSDGSTTVCRATTPKSYVRLQGVCPLPTLTVGPSSPVVIPGTQTTFTAAIDWPAVTYQWYLGSSGDTRSPIAGARSSTLTVGSIPRAYWCRVTDECGIAHTDSQTLVLAVTVNGVVCQPIVINQQPQPADVTSGGGATLMVDAVGSGNLTYTWFQTGSTIPLGTNAQVTVHPTVTSSYYVQIGQTCLNNSTNADSMPATIHIRSCAGINITAEPPAEIMIKAGETSQIQVTATSSDTIGYQWYQGDNGDTSTPLSSGGSTVFVSPAETTSYWVRLTTTTCTVDSYSTVVKVCHPPVVSAVQGSYSSLVRGQVTTLSVSAAGTDLTYQWYTGVSGDIARPIGGAVWSWIAINPQNTTKYWVRVTGLCGDQDSNAVTITVCAVPVITQQPLSVSIYSGSTATLTVTATEATTTPITYQWYRGLSGDASHPVGTNSPAFTTPPLLEETSYWVSLTCDVCGAGASDAALVSICPLAPSMTGAPSQSISLGQTVRLTIPPFSPATGNTFFWYQGVSGDTSHPLGDFGGDWGPYNYLDVSPAVNTQYWAQIKNGTCVANTTTTTVSVCIPTITQHPAGLMMNSGQSTTLTVTATGPGLTYQWYRGTSGDTSTPVGTNSSSFTTPALTVDTSYWVRVTGTCGTPLNSNTATITICQTPAITSQPAGTSLVRGQSTTIGVSATGTNLTYQWYLGTSGNTGSPVAGNANLYTVTSAQNPVDYWVKVTGTCGTAANSNTAHISVCTTPTINNQPQSTTIFSGASATLSVAASEATSEAMHYQWHRGTTSPVNVGTDSPTYNTGSLSSATTYYVTITAGVCTVDSTAATVSICTYPQSVPGAPNVNTSPGQSVRLTIPSNPGVTAYLWYRGTSGDTSNPIGGWQAANYLDVAPATTTSYWAQWQANSGSCISNTTTTTVNVCIPVITQHPASVTIPSGSTTLSVVSSLAGSTYQWYIGASGTTTSPLSGATAASVTVSPATTTSYWCRVSGPCGTVNSNTATVTICAPPVITHQPTNSASNSGQFNSLYVTATGTNLTYQWYMGASGDTSNPMGVTTNTIQGNPTSSIQYWVKVTGTCGSVNSNAAWMSVAPGILQQPQQTTYVSSGSKGNLSVNATGTGLHYQWWGDSGPVSGAPDSPNFITPNITATANFYCIITSAGGAQTTSWTGTFYLCAGVPIYTTTVTNAGGNCRYLLPNIGGAADSITWYQGQRGDTSVQVGTGSYLYVCPSTSTTYWFRVFNTDANQQVTCYTDSAATTVP